MTTDPETSPVLAVISTLITAGRPSIKDDCGWDTIGDNPTGRPRRSSAHTRHKKDRRLFGGTPWESED